MEKISIHPFNYILIPIVCITSIFCAHTNSQYWLILISGILPLILFKRQLNYKLIALFILSLIPSLIGYILASMYFNHNSWLENTTLVIRIFCLSSISFVYVINLDHEALLIELMRRKLISTSMGFALLATNNALLALKQEFHKIQLSYQMRYGKKAYSIKIIIPLLVAASRYAHNISISLHSRGIGRQRSFYREKLDYTRSDYICILSIVIINIAIQYRQIFS